MIMHLMGISYLIYICTRISINGTLFQKKNQTLYIVRAILVETEHYLILPNLTFV